MLRRWQLERCVETVVVVAVDCDGGKLGFCMVVVKCNVVIAGITCAVVVVDADVVVGCISNDVVDMVVAGQAVG